MERKNGEVSLQLVGFKKLFIINPTSSMDLAIVPILTQSLISLDLFHTASAMILTTSPFILWRESSCFVISQTCSYV